MSEAEPKPPAPPPPERALDPGVRRAWRLWVALLLGSLLISTASWHFLPRKHSKCGRLVELGIDGDVVSLNAARLQVPRDGTWTTLELDFTLEAATALSALRPQPRFEALSVVLDRRGDDFRVLRISRAEELPSAILTYVEGELVERSSLALGAPSAGRLRLARRGDVILATLDGIPLPEIPAPEPGDLELALYPPWSTRLFERVALGRVTTGIGGEVTARPRPVEEALRSPVALVMAAALLALVLTVGRPSAIERLLAGHVAWRPGHVTLFLIGLTVLVSLVAFASGTSGYFAPLGDRRRLGYRLMVLLIASWGVLLLVGRDALVRCWPSIRPRFFMWGGCLIPQLLLVTVLGVLIGSMLLGPGRAAVRDAVAPAPDGTSMRIICYGGSSTRGEPFPDGWPHAYPRQLEARLRALGRGDAAVFNLGMSAATILDIEERLAADLDIYQPTHVVLYSVGNNRPLGAEEFAGGLNRFLDATLAAGAEVLFVEEQDFDLVYGWEDAGREYEVYAEVAAARSIPFLSPRPFFRDHREDFLFVDQNGHLTKYGYRHVAHLVADRILGTTTARAAHGRTLVRPYGSPVPRFPGSAHDP